MARANLVLPITFGTKIVRGPLSDLDTNFTPLLNAFLDSGNGFSNFCTVAGTVNAIQLTSTPPALTLGQGAMFTFFQSGANSNTGPVTVNVDGLGFKAVQTANGAALVGGEIFGLCTLWYDGTKFYLVSPFLADTAINTANSAVNTANSALSTANTALTRSATYGPRLGASGGSANAQTVTNSPALTALAGGTLVAWFAAAVNTGNVTLNVDGLGAHPIVDNIAGNQLFGGEIQGICVAVYSGNWYLISSGSPQRYKSIMRLSGSLVNPGLNVAVNFPVAPTFSRGNSGFVVSSNAVTPTRDGIMILTMTADRAVSYMTLMVNTWTNFMQTTNNQPQCSLTVPLIANESNFIQGIFGTAANWTLTGQAMVYA